MRIRQILKKIFARQTIINTYATIATLSPNKLLYNRCALITGGTSGIGYSIAHEFLKAGCNVVITGRDQQRIEKALYSLNLEKKEYSGSIAIGYLLDNTHAEKFENSIENILKQLNDNGIKRFDILVNNSGINSARFPKATIEEFDKVINTNLRGAFFLSQTVSRYFVSNKIPGNILNISSASGFRPADSAYTLSKWGLRGLTLGLAKSLLPHGINVNGIAPGATATPMLNRETTSNLTHPNTPLGRYIHPKEIANMAVFLVSDMGRSIVGETICMTGGSGTLTYDDVPYRFTL